MRPGARGPGRAPRRTVDTGRRSPRRTGPRSPGHARPRPAGRNGRRDSSCRSRLAGMNTTGRVPPSMSSKHVPLRRARPGGRRTVGAGHEESGELPMRDGKRAARSGSRGRGRCPNRRRCNCSGCRLPLSSRGASCTRLHIRRQMESDHLGGGVRQQHLVARGDTADAAAVHDRAEVVAVAFDRFTGVDRGPDPNLHGWRPRLVAQACCTATAAATASVTRENTENVLSPSPRALRRCPPASDTAPRTMASWRASPVPSRSDGSPTARKSPTMSVRRNVTTPVGSDAARGAGE